MDLNSDETFNLAMSHHYDEQDSNVPMCQEEGCDSPSIQCEIDEETSMYYCSEHAADNGFCCCCGTFIAGWRDFSDMCENCEIEVRDNDDVDEECDDGFYDDIY